LHALKPGADAKIEAVLASAIGTWTRVVASVPVMVRGYEDVSMTSGMLDNLRSVYLKPLRDAEQGLKPSPPANYPLGPPFADEAGRVEFAAAS